MLKAVDAESCRQLHFHQLRMLHQLEFAVSEEGPWVVRHHRSHPLSSYLTEQVAGTLARVGLYQDCFARKYAAVVEEKRTGRCAP
jgi:hypothetical protein